MNNKIVMDNPPCQRAELLKVISGSLDKKGLPASIAALNSKLHGGMVMLLVLLSDDLQPFVWPENETAAKRNKYRALVGKEIEIVKREEKKEPESPLPLFDKQEEENESIPTGVRGVLEGLPEEEREDRGASALEVIGKAGGTFRDNSWGKEVRGTLQNDL